MNSFIFVQILGIITLIIFVISLQQSKKENFLLLQTGGTLLFIIQYLMANRITGAITFTVVLIRGLVFYYYKKKNLKPSLTVLIIFQVVLLVSTYLTWQNLLSIIPCIATVAKTWGTWQDEMKWTRKTSLLSQGSMIIYNLSASMYTGALTEICNLTSTIIAIWRYDFRKTNNKRLYKKGDCTMSAMRFSEATELRTERLIIRPIKPTDAPAYYIMRSDPEINRYTGLKPCPSVEAAGEYLQRLMQDAAEHTAIGMTVVDIESGEIAGGICYWNLSEDATEAELGYVFLPKFHGCGVAFESLTSFLELGFSSFGFVKIFADPSPANEASLRLLRKLGFTGGEMCDAQGREDLCHFERIKSI